MTGITPTMEDMVDCVCDAGAQGYTREEFARFLRKVNASAVRDAANDLAHSEPHLDPVRELRLIAERIEANNANV